MSLLRAAEWRVCRNSSTNMATLLENLFPNKKRRDQFSLTGDQSIYYSPSEKNGEIRAWGRTSVDYFRSKPWEQVSTLKHDSPRKGLQKCNLASDGFVVNICETLLFLALPFGRCKSSHARQRKVGTTVAQDWLGLPCPLRASEVVLTGILCDGCGKPIARDNSEKFSKVLL